MDEGANGLELDFNVTLDGEVIVGTTFDPTEIRARIRRWGSSRPVRTQPILPSDPQHRRPTSELLLSDVRRYFGYANKKTKERADAVIPTLTEFMEWADEEERLGLVFFDVKLPPREAKLVPRLMQRLDLLVERLRPRFRIVLESCHAEVVAELARLGPSLRARARRGAPPGHRLQRGELQRGEGRDQAPLPHGHAAEAAQHHALAVQDPPAHRGARPRADARSQRARARAARSRASSRS